jgi:hypothetical protein
VTQPTAQEDQFEVSHPVTLKEEFLKNLKTLDPFLHTVSPTYMENNKRKKDTHLFSFPLNDDPFFI